MIIVTEKGCDKWEGGNNPQEKLVAWDTDQITG